MKKESGCYSLLPEPAACLLGDLLNSSVRFPLPSWCPGWGDNTCWKQIIGRGKSCGLLELD